MKQPEECESMAEVRAGVDALDEEIVTRLAKRFRFMAAAARIKPERSHVRDEERKAAVLDHVRSIAIASEAPADLIVRLYDQLVEASIQYEFEEFDAR
jgi:isochorismate pyruvate lyase